MCDNWIAGYSLPCRPAAAPAALSTEEFERIVQRIPGTDAGIRYRALFSMIYYTGCRRDAIRKLRVDECDIAERWAYIHTKGGKEQVVTIPHIAARRMVGWMVRRPESPWLFPSLRDNSRPIYADAVTRALPRYAKAAGIERRVYVHLLRHSHASRLAEAGVSIDVIQAALGHSQIETTQRYIRGISNTARVRKAVDSVFG